MTEKDMAKQHATENHAAARQPAEQPSGKQMPERQTVKAEAAEEKAMEKETGKKKREAEGNYKRDTVKRVLSYIGAYRLLVLFSLVLAAVTVALTLYIPILIGDAVDLIVGKGQVDFPGLFRIFRVMVVVIASTSAAQWLMNAINNHITYRGGHGHQDEGFQPSGIPSPALYRQPSVRGYSEPDYYGCRSVLRTAC